MAIDMAIRKSRPTNAPKRRYSVAEARDRLPALVHEAQAVPVEITRRGTPVAAIVSIEDYQQVLRARQGFGDLYERFRREAASADLDAASRALVDLRDPSPGRPLP
jgi:prevent-host-death family protein